MNTPLNTTPNKKSKPEAQGLVARITGMNRLFLFTVVLPTLISAIYFGLIASDVYISESRFVVRSPEQKNTSPLGVVLQGAGFARSQDDSYTVQNYMLSRDALKFLDSKLGIAKSFASGNVDLFSRFAGLDWDDSFEALHLYYQKHIDIQLDSVSSITVLTVRAFSSEDAWRINQLLLEQGENLVNQLNERGRQDLIRFAAQDVAQAERKTKEAALALSNYRNLKGVFDPERQSAIQLGQIAKLQDELIATKSMLVQLQTVSKDNPQIPSLKKRVETLQLDIESESSKVAGGERSLANKAAEYQRLALEREFADKQLAVALSSLEQARNEAQRKQLYLERIAQPSKPDKAMEPRRLRSVIAVLVLGLVMWGVLSILIAGIKEHQD